MKEHCIIDLSNMYHRAFHAVKGLTTSKGFPVGAVQGTANMIISLVKNRKTPHITVALDSKSSWRKEKYNYYKANRSETDTLLAAQLPYIHDMVDAFGLNICYKEGYEADDVIASLVKNSKRPISIVSSDKDFAQLVDKNVVLYDARKNVVYDAPGVLEKWGVPPSKMRDYLALVGDSSDNVPGVKGIGPKGAIKLLETYNTIEGIYENIDKHSKGITKKLVENKTAMIESRELVTMVDTLFENEDQSSHVRSMDKQKLKNIFFELEMKSVAAKLGIVI